MYNEKARAITIVYVSLASMRTTFSFVWRDGLLTKCIIHIERILCVSFCYFEQHSTCFIIWLFLSWHPKLETIWKKTPNLPNGRAIRNGDGTRDDYAIAWSTGRCLISTAIIYGKRFYNLSHSPFQRIIQFWKSNRSAGPRIFDISIKIQVHYPVICYFNFLFPFRLFERN